MSDDKEIKTETVFQAGGYQIFSNGGVYGPQQIDELIRALEDAKAVFEDEYEESPATAYLDVNVDHIKVVHIRDADAGD